MQVSCYVNLLHPLGTIYRDNMVHVHVLECVIAVTHQCTGTALSSRMREAVDQLKRTKPGNPNTGSMVLAMNFFVAGSATNNNNSQGHRILNSHNLPMR